MKLLHYGYALYCSRLFFSDLLKLEPSPATALCAGGTFLPFLQSAKSFSNSKNINNDGAKAPVL